MERWAGRVALVTGASYGIGSATARCLASHGMTVVACARSLDRLQTLCEEVQKEGGGKIVPMQCDLKSTEDIMAMFENIKSDFGGVDVCVNNAGLAHSAPLTSADDKLWREILDVNVVGLSICTREAVKSMRSRGVDDGHILNVNSVSGHTAEGFMGLGMYSASKFAVTALTEALRQELKADKSNIRVTCVSPAVVETNFSYQLLPDNPQAAKDFYSSAKFLQAEDIADLLRFILASPPHVQIHDVLLKSTFQKF